MLITDYFVYLQNQKCGSTYISAVLKEMYGGVCYKKHQAPSDHTRFKNKTIVISVRNPWDIYVSLFAHGCTKDSYCGFKGALEKDRRRNAGVLKLYSELSPENFRLWVSWLLSRQGKKVAWYGSMSQFNGIGLATFWLCRLAVHGFNPRNSVSDIYEQFMNFGRDSVVMKLEQIHEDMKSLLLKIGVNRNLDTAISGIGTNYGNSTVHKRSSKYYNEETIGLVRDNDRLIVDMFDYHEPS